MNNLKIIALLLIVSCFLYSCKPAASKKSSKEKYEIIKVVRVIKEKRNYDPMYLGLFNEYSFFYEDGSLERVSYGEYKMHNIGDSLERGILFRTAN